jgi:hypothetical protein
MTEEQKNCGACGLYFGAEQSDAEGFHSPNFCEVAEENEFIKGAKYAIEYLMEIFDGIEDTDIYSDYFGKDKDEPLICQLCGKEIKDIQAGAVVLPWGDTCGECLKEIKAPKEEK